MVRAGSPIVKLVSGALGMAAECLALNPQLTIIGRVYTPVTALQQYKSGDSPEQAAQDFIDSQIDVYHVNPLIKIWEGHNEFSCGGPDDSDALNAMSWFGQHEAERVKIMSGLGYRCAVGNFSTGYPEINIGDLRMWNAFLPAVSAAALYNGFLALHEYAAPWLWWWAGDFQKGNCDPTTWSFPGGTLQYDEGWLTLRYRQVYRYALAPVGLADVPLVITECGCDAAGGGCPDMPTGAWKDLTAYWNQWSGVSDPIPYWRGPERDAERYYAEQLIWYDRELRKDSYVVGATPFTFGTDNPTWDHYNIAGSRVPGYLCDYIRAEAGAGNTPPPLPIPVPIPSTENKMPTNISDLDFGKTYVWDAKPGAPEPGNTILIPQNIGFEYVHDPAVRVTWPDIKQGSPTYGQPRTSDSPFLKPEVMPKVQSQMADIPFPIGVLNLSKCFKGFGPIWVMYTVALNMIAGQKYKLTWPVWPNLLSSDEGGKKVYADDPAAGWLRLRVKAGDAAMTIDSTKSPDRTWYCGLDFAFGRWFVPQVIIDATQPVMTVGLELMSIFGLKDSDFMLAPPTLELVSGDVVPEPPPISGGTVRALSQAALVSAQEAAAGVQQVVNNVTALNELIG